MAGVTLRIAPSSGPVGVTVMTFIPKAGRVKGDRVLNDPARTMACRTHF